MKLIRFGEQHYEKPGIVLNDKRYDVSAHFEDYNENFFIKNGLTLLKSIDINTLPEVAQTERLGCPIARPSKIICIGLNYSDHAKESNMEIPNEPVIFMKATTAIVGPNDAIVIPKGSEKTDWEVELAIVIGKKASYINKEVALDYIAGYCLHNDVSERAYQLERGGTWDKGKGCDSFAPLGPWLVTTDEIKDPHQLNLWLTVNGQTMQQGNTQNLIFDIPTIISYVSQFMTLLPGDIISTGTPAGVGLGFNPAIYLKPGDVVELGIDGLGAAKQTCIAYQN
jgi:2,4-didehydro-3-deoxy-L-rhamnonate hydrolase